MRSESGQDFPQTPTPDPATYSPEGRLPASVLAEGTGTERGALRAGRAVARMCVPAKDRRWGGFR